MARSREFRVANLDNKVDGGILGCYVAILCGVLTFWAALAVAVIHFIHKFW